MLLRLSLAVLHFPCALNLGFHACPYVPEFGASALPSKPLAIKSLMNSASPPITVTQLSFKGLFWIHNQSRGSSVGHDNGPNSNFFLSAWSNTFIVCSCFFSVQPPPSSLNNRSPQLAAERRRWVPCRKRRYLTPTRPFPSRVPT